MGIRKLEEPEDNARVERIPGMNAMTLRRDFAPPLPVGSYVACIFRVTGYDLDCDGSAMARMEGVDRYGGATGWTVDSMGLYPDSEVGLDGPGDLHNLVDYKPPEPKIEDINVARTAALLSSLRLGSVSIEASAIVGSPHMWAYLFLTEEEHEGPHYIVSAAREYEPVDGVLVGYHRHHEDMTSEVERVADEEAAIQWIRKHQERTS